MGTALTQKQAEQVATEAKVWLAAHSQQARLISFEQLVEIEEKECYLLRVAYGDYIATHAVKRIAKGIESLISYTYDVAEASK